jgi:phage shock protein E
LFAQKNYYLLSVNFYLEMSLFSILGLGNGKLKEALRRGAVIIDIRTAGEFDRGKVHDSINIPVDRININLKRIVQMNRAVIICSNSDVENERVIEALKANGVKEIYNGGNWTKLWRMMRSL